MKNGASKNFEIHDTELRKIFPMPTPSKIRRILNRFEETDYCAEEKRIIAFFQQIPGNDNEQDVLLKTAALKHYMGCPNLLLSSVIHHILSQKDFDRKLQSGVKNIVDGIASCSPSRGRYTVFARQYCAFHRPDRYLGDSGWRIALRMYDRLDRFMQGKHFPSTTRYAGYVRPFLLFRDFYALQQYSLPDLQHFLYQTSREFLRHYGQYHTGKDLQRHSHNALVLDLIGCDEADTDQ